ncbi:PTPLA-domain-containing protein [Didymella exigua CBS 183.55]|uniref:Very-long-chain (3R)-3-hydroxyacyl-CoA dehydratase n=1 Tax=Didymella exigua CBS 183.55 TaxID=1150837 RepID=A0A6A5S1X1_9PLEO|nr:PTPLA-domain-containing protein [Didymella exigua CBS 183.55]KAF1933288.1 PTPLA-domain-containing protein [Didymella exigua CBS 183.55]
MPPEEASVTSPRNQRPAESRPASSPLKHTYLLAYNAVSAALWVGVLYKTVTIGTHEVQAARKAGSFFGRNDLQSAAAGLASGRVYAELEEHTRLVQSLAGLEVLHSLFGIVRAPLLTTLMQVASRFLLVWGIAYNFPATTQHSPAYSTMLLAWSFTEVVRYSYFVFTLSGLRVPSPLSFLRYNTFTVLYPLGIASECWLVYQSIPAAQNLDERIPYVLLAILAFYVPGSYVLFTHMVKQRRRIARQASPARSGLGYDQASEDRIMKKMRMAKYKQAMELQNAGAAKK